ncbi:MAG: protease inhibitor I42 family protein [Actinomycetota bacterium]|nr:protease inhibitor I42 family protein [Actinomycetota bacterium]
MLRRAAVLIVIALLLGLAGACNDEDAAEGLTFEDPKGSVDVERGMTFTFEFSVNAGVGYDWQPVATPGGLVELKDTKVEYPDEERAGDSGVKRFVYEANDTGRQSLVFRRLFRGEPQERRTATVNIRG